MRASARIIASGSNQMKPNSALILDQNGIVLLHRAQNGWRVIGQADPSSENLAGEMDYLRRTAMALSGGKFATKIVVPNDQILYREIDVGEVDAADKSAAVREALEGLTPYGVDELSFDWRAMGGNVVQVAVIAEETLEEAEFFAESHGFNPLCFAAIDRKSVV